jgi:hypothetical protein
MNSAIERIEGSTSGKLVFDDVLALPAELKSGYKNQKSKAFCFIYYT